MLQSFSAVLEPTQQELGYTVGVGGVGVAGWEFGLACCRHGGWVHRGNGNAAALPERGIGW